MLSTAQWWPRHMVTTQWRSRLARPRAVSEHVNRPRTRKLALPPCVCVCVCVCDDRSTHTHRNSDSTLKQMAKAAALAQPLADKLAEYRATRHFDAEAWVTKKCARLNEYMARCGLKACITSVSGGVDSAVVLALVARAAKQPGSPITSVVGLCQPIHSSAWALERGREAIKAVGAREIVVDQTAEHTHLAQVVETAVGKPGNAFARGQLRSYMRTPVGYYVAQLFSATGEPAIVMGTGNQDEDGYVGFFAKAGDGVVDVGLIHDLHKSEVFAIGAFLGVPASILSAQPSADLWDGQSDEGELGFSYDFIELWTGAIIKMNDEERARFVAGLPADAREQFESWGAKAVAVHKRNAHKLAGIVNL
jgi:NAD+ synthase (glutamine-hydrolysing)